MKKSEKMAHTMLAGAPLVGGAIASQLGVYPTMHKNARGSQYFFVTGRKSDGLKPHAEPDYKGKVRRFIIIAAMRL